jgi:hypothetical protein
MINFQEVEPAFDVSRAAAAPDRPGAGETVNRPPAGAVLRTVNAGRGPRAIREHSAAMYRLQGVATMRQNVIRRPSVAATAVPAAVPGRLALPDLAVRLAGALLALAISVVHIADQGSVPALVTPHWIGWGYRAVEVGGVLTALALMLPWGVLLRGSAARPVAARLGWAAAILLGAGPFIGYVASRSVGVPGDPGDVGNWGYWVGTVSLFAEAALITLSVGVLLALRDRRPADGG